MTAGEPRNAAGTAERTLSTEEAERLAAAIRPSWELDDDVLGAGGSPPRAEAEGSARAVAPTAPGLEVLDGGWAAAPARPSATPAVGAPILDPPTARIPDAPPAGAQGASDTIIEGVPTIALEGSSEIVTSSSVERVRASEVPGESPPRATRSRRSIRPESANGAAPAQTAGGPSRGDQGSAPTTSAETAGDRDQRHEGSAAISAAPPAGESSTMPGAAPVPAGRTKVGMGEPDAEPSAAFAPAQALARPASVRPGGEAPQSRPPARAGSERPRSTSERVVAPPPSVASAEENEPIELPVTGTSKATLRIVIAVVGAGFLFFAARAMFSVRDEDTATAPGAASTTAAPPQTRGDPAASTAAQTPTVPSPAAASAPATAAPLPAATPAPTAATASPPVATATPPARPSATPAAPSVPEKHAVTPRAPAGEKKPASPPPTQGGTASTGGKKGGGIIRDAPF